jgi:hypothetical protein
MVNKISFMIEAEFLSEEEEKHFLYFIKHNVILNKKKAHSLISDLEETIVELNEQLQGKSPLEKNTIYAQIANRKDQIKYANTFL